MDTITSLLDGMDFTKLVPDLDTLLGKVQLAATVAVMIGPLILLVLGLVYLLIPPKEANHKAGFRTYFGMGSVEAWRFTQRIAGMVLGGLGLVLSIVMGINCLSFGGKELMQVVDTAATCLIWQIVLVAVSYLAISILAAVMFDKNGNRRKKRGRTRVRV